MSPDVIKDWAWLKRKYYTPAAVLEDYPHLLEVDPRLPALLVQVQSAERMIIEILDKAMKEALNDTED